MSRQTPIVVAHIITGLGLGGAEKTLYNLLRHLSRGQFHHRVLSLTETGYIGYQIQELGIQVDSLSMHRGAPGLRGFISTIRWLRSVQPHIVQTWMYHADLLGILAAKIGGSPPVVWNVRASDMVTPPSSTLLPGLVRTCAILSSRPKAIVVNSIAGRDAHIQLGYRPQRWVLIENGVDTEEFRPDENARLQIRSELDLDADEIIIGMVARFDPKKDHTTFLHAAKAFVAKSGIATFVLCGAGVNQENDLLMLTARSLGIESRVRLLGPRHDIAQVTAAFDIATLASAYGEGFPNVVAEAMACEVPCVVTNVGDAARLVDKTGIVVAAADAESMADSWLRMIELGKDGRQRLGKQARIRVIEEFSMPKMVDRYAELYESIAHDRYSPQSSQAKEFS